MFGMEEPLSDQSTNSSMRYTSY